MRLPAKNYVVVFGHCHVIPNTFIHYIFTKHEIKCMDPQKCVVDKSVRTPRDGAPNQMNDDSFTHIIDGLTKPYNVIDWISGVKLLMRLRSRLMWGDETKLIRDFELGVFKKTKRIGGQFNPPWIKPFYLMWLCNFVAWLLFLFSRTIVTNTNKSNRVTSFVFILVYLSKSINLGKKKPSSSIPTKMSWNLFLVKFYIMV